MRAAQTKRPGWLEGRKTRGRGGGRRPGLWGKRPRGGDLSGLDASAGGRHLGGGGVLAVLVVWGLLGVGRARPPAGAAVPVGRTAGAAPWGAMNCGAGSWAWAGYGYRPCRCPAAEPGAGRPAASGRPLAAAGRVRARHTRQRPCDQGGPACSRADKCASHRPSAHPRPARGQRTQVHQPGRAGLARPRRSPARSSPSPAAPERERPHPKKASTANPGNRPHRPRDPPHPPGSPGPQSKTCATPTTQPPPPPPADTTTPTQTPAQTLGQVKAGLPLGLAGGSGPAEAYFVNRVWVHRFAWRLEPRGSSLPAHLAPKRNGSCPDPRPSCVRGK